jgi:hypothetical protein
LTLALKENELSAPRPVLFTAMEREPNTNWTRSWMDPGRCEIAENVLPLLEINPQSSSPLL